MECTLLRDFGPFIRPSGECSTFYSERAPVNKQHERGMEVTCPRGDSGKRGLRNTILRLLDSMKRKLTYNMSQAALSPSSDESSDKSEFILALTVATCASESALAVSAMIGTLQPRSHNSEEAMRGI